MFLASCKGLCGGEGLTEAPWAVAAVFEKEENGGLAEQVWGSKGGWLGVTIRRWSKVLES